MCSRNCRLDVKINDAVKDEESTKPQINMPESFATKLDRWKFNLFPAYRGSGARVQYIADDYSEMQIKIPLN